MSSEAPTSKLAAMEGAGFYNRNSSVQATSIEGVLRLWEQVAASVPVGDEPLVIADYAASQGRNSMAPMKIAIEALRANGGADRPVDVIHTDLPSNDFAALFEALAEDPDSYMAATSAVFPFAVGRSYFDPILPPERVHLAWNSWSLHWLSGKVNAADHCMPALSRDPAVLSALAARKADDLRRFLAARATELRPGGRLLSISLGALPDRTGHDWVFKWLWDCVEEMGREGLLSANERLRCTFPSGPRTQADIEAPFAEGGSFAGLTLDHVEVFDGPDPHWSTYQANGDALAFGQAQSDWCRAWGAPTLAAAIEPGRDRAALVDDFFARLAARFAADPQKSTFFLVSAVVTRER